MAAIFFGESQFVRCKSGAKKIPPPMPIIPEIKPIKLPKLPFFFRFKGKYFCLLEKIRLEIHILIAAKSKVKPNKVKKKF